MAETGAAETDLRFEISEWVGVSVGIRFGLPFQGDPDGRHCIPGRRRCAPGPGLARLAPSVRNMSCDATGLVWRDAGRRDLRFEISEGALCRLLGGNGL
jgi:hypothetical protein